MWLLTLIIMYEKSHASPGVCTFTSYNSLSLHVPISDSGLVTYY